MEWAESAGNEKITRDDFIQAASRRLDKEQVIVVNAAIWGFIAAVVSGSADTLFMGCDRLSGLGGWNRVARYISHGEKVYLETLRREMKVVVGKPMSSMDKPEESIA